MSGTTPDTYVLGPGTLKIGPTGALVNYSGQFFGAVVSPEVNKEDDIPVLSGSVLPGERTYKWKISLKLFQDLLIDGLVKFSWANAGTQKDFEFIPNTVGAKKITGVLVIDPISIGGEEMKKRPTSDIELEIVGTPVLADVA